MIAEIRTALKTKLDTLTGSNKPLVSVLNYHTLENTGFPYATIEPTSYTGDVLDTCNNLRPVTFDLYIYQEITKNGRDEAMDILVKANDDVIDLLDLDYTLGGLAQGGVIPVQGDFGQIVSGNGKTLFVNIKIVCNVIKNIYS